jgi:hypothetical protein
MKKITTLLTTLNAIVLLALVSGCATTKQTEDLLSAAGFKPQPATTPEQQAHLKALPAHKVSSVQRDGKQYFVYPDVAHNVLYIGSSDQYQEYQRLRKQQQLAEEQNTPAEQMQINWSVWGGW